MIVYVRCSALYVLRKIAYRVSRRQKLHDCLGVRKKAEFSNLIGKTFSISSIRVFRRYAKNKYWRLFPQLAAKIEWLPDICPQEHSSWQNKSTCQATLSFNKGFIRSFGRVLIKQLRVIRHWQLLILRRLAIVCIFMWIVDHLGLKLLCVKLR